MESVINKTIEWFKDISEATKELTSGNVSHKACAIRGLANGSAEYLEEYKVGLSAIRWQTGEPKEDGSYIVTTDEGTVGIASFYNEYSPDVEFFRICVTAWCKLRDIKPYKEEMIMNTLLESVNEILDLYKEDDKRCGGYSMTEWLIDSAPEDYNEYRIDWLTLKGRADDMYYMLEKIKGVVERMKEEMR